MFKRKPNIKKSSLEGKITSVGRRTRTSSYSGLVEYLNITVIDNEETHRSCFPLGDIHKNFRDDLMNAYKENKSIKMSAELLTLHQRWGLFFAKFQQRAKKYLGQININDQLYEFGVSGPYDRDNNLTTGEVFEVKPLG
jgi:hypothetical protein